MKSHNNFTKKHESRPKAARLAEHSSGKNQTCPTPNSVTYHASSTGETEHLLRSEESLPYGNSAKKDEAKPDVLIHLKTGNVAVELKITITKLQQTAADESDSWDNEEWDDFAQTKRERATYSLQPSTETMKLFSSDDGLKNE